MVTIIRGPRGAVTSIFLRDYLIGTELLDRAIATHIRPAFEWIQLRVNTRAEETVFASGEVNSRLSCYKVNKVRDATVDNVQQDELLFREG